MRRPASQLKALSKLARHGKPWVTGRQRLPAGTLRFGAHGKSAALVARIAADPARRRVFVRATIASGPRAHSAAFCKHLDYLRREGAGRDGARAGLFDRDTDTASARSFRDLSRGDPHQYRILVAPDDSGRMEDLSGFTRKLMNQVERDLGTPVDWVAACHFNTAQAHVHIVIRGGNDRDGILYIDPAYLTYGFRHRSEEIATLELGYCSAEEAAALDKGLTRARRLTSLDRELARAARNGELKLAEPTGPMERHGWRERLLRLVELRRLGLVRHVHGDHWRFTRGWTESLERLGERTLLAETLRRSAGLHYDPLSVDAPAPGAVGGWITGRYAGLANPDSSTPAPRLLVEGLDGRLWILPAEGSDTDHLPERGAVVTVYRPALLAGRQDNRRQAVPVADMPLMIQVNSWLPVNALVDRRAHTWLDGLQEAELQDHGAGFGAEVRAAWRARQAFLQGAGLLPVDREALMATEIAAVASSEAARSAKRFVRLGQREVFRGNYTANLDTAQGRFAVIASEGRFVLAPLTDELAGLRGKSVAVERAAMSNELTLARGRSLGR